MKFHIFDTNLREISSPLIHLRDRNIYVPIFDIPYALHDTCNMIKSHEIE